MIPSTTSSADMMGVLINGGSVSPPPSTVSPKSSGPSSPIDLQFDIESQASSTDQPSNQGCIDRIKSTFSEYADMAQAKADAFGTNHPFYTRFFVSLAGTLAASTITYFTFYYNNSCS
jgi:hypothetical protein